MRARLSVCILALAVQGCAPPDTTPVQPFNEAQYAGRLRAAQLLRAKDCTPNEVELAKEVRENGSAPSSYTPSSAASFHTGFAEWYPKANKPDFSFQACQALRADPAYTAIFRETAITSVSNETKPVRLKSRQPAYCPNGYIEAKIESDWSMAKNTITKECQTGDSLLLPAFASGLIASVCDMSKPISKINEDVVCTFGVARDFRSR